jgi:hypothetical protein
VHIPIHDDPSFTQAAADLRRSWRLIFSGPIMWLFSVVHSSGSRITARGVSNPRSPLAWHNATTSLRSRPAASGERQSPSRAALSKVARLGTPAPPLPASCPDCADDDGDDDDDDDDDDALRAWSSSANSGTTTTTTEVSAPLTKACARGKAGQENRCMCPRLTRGWVFLVYDPGFNIFTSEREEQETRYIEPPVIYDKRESLLAPGARLGSRGPPSRPTAGRRTPRPRA